MSTDHAGSLSELELDALWTVYEGHSLVIERPDGGAQDARAHVILSVAYDEADEAVAEVAEIPLDTVEELIDRGFLARSEDGPVLDAHSWFDEELGLEVSAEEYLLSELGQRIIDDTAMPEGEASAADRNETEDDLEDEDDFDGDDDDDDDDFGDDDDDSDDDDDLWDDDDEDDFEDDDGFNEDDDSEEED